MSIPATSSASPPISGLTGPTPAALQRPDANPGGAGVFEEALQGVGDALAEADQMSQQVATGQLTDLSQLTAAAAKAELAVQLTVAFRDRAIDSFQQIMRMQI